MITFLLVAAAWFGAAIGLAVVFGRAIAQAEREQSLYVPAAWTEELR